MLGFAISGLAVYLLLQQVNIDALLPALAAAQPLFILVVVVSVLASLVTRAARWQVFFLPDLKVPFPPLLETLSISYMASTFLPLRAGELVRAVFLGQRASISVPRVVGTILIEKLFDFLAVGVLIVLFVPRAPQLPDAVRAAALSVAGVIVIGFGSVMMLAVFREPSLRVIGIFESLLPAPARRWLPLQRAARQFAEGTDSLRYPRLWGPLLGWTAVTWILSLASVAGGIAALGVSPTAEQVLLVSILTSAGQAVPSSPGYVGVYHLASKTALTTLGVDPTTAVAIALVTHAFSYGSLVIAGLVALWTGGYTFGDVLSGVNRKGAAPKPAVALAPER